MKSAASRVTTAAEGLSRRRITVAEVEAMVAAGITDGDERVELIGGDLVPMAPKGDAHEVVKSALVDHWTRESPLDDLPAQRKIRSGASGLRRLVRGSGG